MQAITYLQEAETLVKGVKQGVNILLPVEEVDPDDLMLESEARIQALLGLAHFHMGNSEESLPRLNDALRILGNPQPSNKLSVFVRFLWEAMKQWFHMKLPSAFIGRTSQIKSIRLLEQAHCLCYLFQEYHDNHEDMKALMSAIQEVNRAEQSDDDLHELIVAYTNLIQCCQLQNWTGWAEKFEKTALVRCNHILSDINPDDLLTVCHLYIVSLHLRMSVGKLQGALEAGNAAYAIANSVHDNEMKLLLLPTYTIALLMTEGKYIDIVKQLSILAQEQEDIATHCWYYACCLNITLEIGYQLESANQCTVFADECMQELTVFSRDSTPRFFLFACLAVWCSRCQLWKETDNWLQKAEAEIPEKLETFLVLHSYCKCLECELVAFAHAVGVPGATSKEVQKLEDMKKRVKKYFLRLEIACVVFPVFMSRYQILNAYWIALQNKGHLSSAQKELQKAIKTSERFGNKLDSAWAQHNLDSWTAKPSKIDWLDYVTSDRNFADHNAIKDPVRPTLQLPYIHRMERPNGVLNS